MKIFYEFFLGGKGKKALVFFLYASKLGFPSYFFSNIGMPETFKIRKVMVRGPIKHKKLE